MKKIKKDRPEKKLVIHVPPIRQRLSTIELIKRAISIWLDRRVIRKRSFKDPSAGMPNLDTWSNIYYFAIVVGDDVVDVMRVQPKMAAWLQGEPKFVMFDPAQEFSVAPGFKYIDGKLVDPNINLDIKPESFNLGKSNEK